jgi:hypothetical protein
MPAFTARREESRRTTIAMFNERVAGAIGVERTSRFCGLRQERGKGRGHADGADQPGLHQLPARIRLRRSFPEALGDEMGYGREAWPVGSQG